MQFIVFGKADGSIDEYLRSQADPRLPVIDKPARKIPIVLRQIIQAIEGSDQPGRSDFVIALLSLSDRALDELGTAIDRTTAATRADKKLHSVYAQYDQTSVAIACAYGDPERMPVALSNYCMARKYRTRAINCLGVGLDLSFDSPPVAFVYLQGAWQHDEELDKLATRLLGPE
jgi:hypothetical protein